MVTKHQHTLPYVPESLKRMVGGVMVKAVCPCGVEFVYQQPPIADVHRAQKAHLTTKGGDHDQ